MSAQRPLLPGCALLLLAACQTSTRAPLAPPPRTPEGGPRVTANAAPDPELPALVELAARGPDAKDYPQADAVIALLRDDITLRPDGTVVEHHKSIVKLLDPQRGKEKFADVHIPLDRQREELDILIARTVNADGVPHVASKDEIGEIVPERLEQATIYSDIRERVVSFPAVDTGSVIELEYTRTIHATPDAPLGGEALLGTWDPVLERTITISAPAGVTPKLQVVGMALEPTQAKTADGNVWAYTLRSLPDRHPEHDSPPEAAVLPRLVFAFRDTWASVEQALATRFLGVALPAQPAPAVRLEAERVVHGASTASDKAMRLFAFVAHDIRTIELELGEAGYEPHAPEAVLQSRYGDSRDKASLLIALAATQGIAGRPVLVRTGKVPVLSLVPTVAQFDHLLVTLTVDGNDVWLDPSDEDGQYGLAFAGQDNLVLPLELASAANRAGGLVQRPAQKPEQSLARVRAQLALAANGDLDASYDYELSGYYANRASHELRPLDGEPLAHFFQGAAVEIAAAAIDRGHHVGDTRTVTGPIAVSQRIAIPGYAPAQNAPAQNAPGQTQFRVFELPELPLELADDVPSAGLSSRTAPLYVGAPRASQRDVTLALPPGWKVAYLPPKLEGATAGVSFSSECHATGQSVRCHEQIALDQVLVLPEQYSAFRSALTRLEAYERRVVLLTRG